MYNSMTTVYQMSDDIASTKKNCNADVLSVIILSEQQITTDETNP